MGCTDNKCVRVQFTGVLGRYFLVLLSKHINIQVLNASNAVIPTDDTIVSQESETFELVLLSDNYTKRCH